MPIFSGTELAETLNGTAQNDLISGAGGDDSLFGGAGDDTIAGGLGNDTLIASEGLDSLEGGEGNDQLYSRTTAMAESFDDGANHMSGGDGNDSIYGGNANDTLLGGLGTDLLFGSGGNDSLNGGDGEDLISGGAGNGGVRDGDEQSADHGRNGHRDQLGGRFSYFEDGGQARGCTGARVVVCEREPGLLERGVEQFHDDEDVGGVGQGPGGEFATDDAAKHGGGVEGGCERELDATNRSPRLGHHDADVLCGLGDQVGYAGDAVGGDWVELCQIFFKGNTNRG